MSEELVLKEATINQISLVEFDLKAPDQSGEGLSPNSTNLPEVLSIDGGDNSATNYPPVEGHPDVALGVPEIVLVAPEAVPIVPEIVQAVPVVPEVVPVVPDEIPSFSEWKQKVLEEEKSGTSCQFYDIPMFYLTY